MKIFIYADVSYAGDITVRGSEIEITTLEECFPITSVEVEVPQAAIDYAAKKSTVDSQINELELRLANLRIQKESAA